jgi:hypothetical protein
MTRPRRRSRLLAGAVTVALALLAGSQALIVAPATAAVPTAAVPTAAVPTAAVLTAGPVAAAPSSGCGRYSCTYTKAGQSLFRVPPGVDLLQVDVIGAGAAPASGHRPPATLTSTPTKGEAVEVKGNLVLPSGVSTLEVVVGGKDTLGGTTSEIMTSTDSTSTLLAAADGVPVPPATKHPTSAKGRTPARSTTTVAKAATKNATSKKTTAKKTTPKKTTHASSGVNRLVSTPTRIPTGGTVTPATGPARVVIKWRSPFQAPLVLSSSSLVMTAGASNTFVVRVIAATVPTLTELGSLPLGVTFRDQGNGTASLAGVPLVDGVYRVKVLAFAGDNPPVTQHLSLVVQGGLIRLG